MRTIDVLHELQRVDTALAADRRRLGEIVAALRDHSALDEASQRLAQARAELERLQTEQRDQELAIETQRAKLKEINTKLYSGKVPSAKELDNLSREADMLRRLLSAREDTLLELYDRIEAAQAAVEAAERAHREAEAALRERQAELRAEGRELEAAVAALGAQRTELRAKAPPRALADYDRLAQARGTAVAELRQRTCQACRVSLPLGDETRARVGQEVVHCPNCGRILWVPL